MKKIYVVVNNGEVVGAYTTEEKAKEVTKAEKMATEMGGGYARVHYEEVTLD